MVQPIFHFVRGFTKGVTNRGDSGTRENGTGRLGGREGEDDSCGEMAGVLQKFTRGPVHEHVNVEPGGVPVVTVPNVRHVCEFMYTLTCARARAIYIYVRVHEERRRKDLGICPSRVSGHHCTLL